MQLVMSVDAAPVEELLDHMIDRLEHPGPVLQLLGEAMVEYETELFDSNGRGQWAPLDPATIAAKGSTRPLVRTGALMDALTGRATVDGESVAVDGTSYAGYLKYGARGMPRRDPAPEPDHSTMERWADLVLGYVVDGHNGRIG